jgi:N-acyl-D-aspartate/D-glutamate deacylase
MSNDVVIRGGTVIDGTGAPGRTADVAVRDGRIAEVGDRLEGAKELDAAGQVVAPGFIDIHTHYDAQVFWDPALTPSSFHGVTSVVAGNCGFSIAPCQPEHRGLIARTLQHVEDMNLATLEAGVPWDFETFPEYLASVGRRGTLLNYGGYIGHTALRLFVMGDAGYEREATDDEINRMRQIVDEAMAAGAIGFSSTTAPTHNGDSGRPVPSRVATLDEIAAIGAVLGERGQGVVEITPGPTLAPNQMPELQKRIGRPLTWTALLTFKGFPWHEDVMRITHEAHAEGHEVWPQVSCRPLTMQMTLAEPFHFQTVPHFAALAALPVEERAARWSDPLWRAEGQAALDAGKFLRPNWQNVSVAETTSRADLIGRPVADVAAEMNVNPLDVMAEVALADGIENTRFRTVLANDDEDAIESLLRETGATLVGLADSGAHVGQLCDACVFTDLLGNWVRDRGVLPLEAAVHRITGEPARVFGLDDPNGGRGRLDAGMAADITVFDPATVDPGPVRRVRDFPADAERLTADRPTGVTHVLVNGTPIRENAEPTPLPEALPGQLLRS